MANLVYAEPSRYTTGVVDMLARQGHLSIPSSVIHLADYASTHKHEQPKEQIEVR